MNSVHDIIIIGGGPAGYTAALYSARAGLDVVLTEKAAAGGQMALTGTIDNYPGFEDGIDGFTLGMKMQKCAERFGAKTENTEVISVDFSDRVKKVNTAKNTLLGKAVIIATGASPRELGIDGEREFVGRGVHYCAHCDGRFYKGKTVIVVGGGNSAVSDALYLSNIAENVYLVHRKDTLRASKIYADAVFEKENIEFLKSSVIEGFIVDEKLSGAKIKNISSGEMTEKKCDGVFVSIGRKPASEFLENAVMIDKNGYIVADESTKTNVSGVFAAGDVRTKNLRQIVTAVSDGAVAADEAEKYLSKEK